MIIKDNIIKIFVVDTLICSTQALQLMKYQMEKHAWSQEEWEEYYKIYQDNLNKIELVDDNYCEWKKTDYGMFGCNDYEYITGCGIIYDCDKITKGKYCPNCGHKIKII